MIFQMVKNVIEHNRKTIMLYLLVSLGEFLLFDFVLPALGVGQYAGKLSFATIVPILVLPAQLRRKGQFFSHKTLTLSSRQLFMSKTLFDIFCMIMIAALLLMQMLIGSTVPNIADYIFSLVFAFLALQLFGIWDNLDHIFIKQKPYVRKSINIILAFSAIILFLFGMGLIDENTVFDGLIPSEALQVTIYNCLFILFLFSIDYYSFMRRKEY